MKCPSCATEMPSERQSCPYCGTALGDSFTPTQLLPDTPDDKAKKKRDGQRAASTHRSASSISFDSSGGGRFVPGTMLGERYRIGDFIGRGGMGEVYRADDLKLGQPVALKFLPEHLLNDGAALARFHREVRVARQVSHRNVCRVYDIGETDGQHFLSMEYIKGQELATLLKSIGHLPTERAIQLARQLCAGLAAAHETGVLHRDLKPANVMIDSGGNARITDFGLAGLAEEFRTDELRAGTPTYMAPEQLAGKGVTQRSDIYALGLVLYEIFTGRKAYDPRTFDELRRIHESDTTPTSPSSLIKDIDPLVERVILRCLEKDPDKRPASALQVAAALPGGDPLQAALAAGETPSPEMVAAAPKEGSLRPAVAAALLVSVIAGIALVMFLSKQVMLYRMVPLEKSSDVLKERASEIAKRLGYTDAPTDTAYGFVADNSYLKYLKEHDQSRTRLQQLSEGQPSVMRFWFRQSPRYLEPYNSFTVSADDPPNESPGMRRISVDTEGRLFSFESIPPSVDQASDVETKTPDWSILFQEAGLDLSNFQQTDSKWVPVHAFDTRAAWNGFYPNKPQLPIRIEAASYRGKPVYFEIVSPWRTAPGAQGSQESASEKAGTIVVLILFFTVLLGSTLLALKNLRLGRGDRKGAFRLALFVFTVRMLNVAFSAHHVPSGGEVNLLLSALQSCLFWAAFLWVMYIALEPFVRRRWPERIISWSRLLAGGFRDPLVGRDILIGALFGIGLIFTHYLTDLAPQWLGLTPNIPFMDIGGRTLGIGYLGTAFTGQILSTIILAFIVLFILLLLSIILRRDWLGGVIGGLLFATLLILSWTSDKALISSIFPFMDAAIYVIVIYRYGPMALLSALFFFHTWVFYPITTELTAWYAATFVVDLILMISVAVYGFYTSLAGQPLFRGSLLED